MIFCFVVVFDDYVANIIRQSDHRDSSTHLLYRENAKLHIVVRDGTKGVTAVTQISRSKSNEPKIPERVPKLLILLTHTNPFLTHPIGSKHSSNQ